MSEQQMKAFIQKSLIFSYLQPTELDMLISHNIIVTFSPGDMILQQGKKNNALYVIIEGTAIVSAKILGEGITNIETLAAGSFVGEVSFLTGEPCTTSVFASDKIQCLLISKNYFDLLSEFFQATKYKLLVALMQQVCERVRRIHQKITQTIQQYNMIKRSFLGELIKSFNKPKELQLSAESSEYLNLLCSSDLFSAFDADEVEVILKNAQIIDAPKNINLIQENEKNTSFYIILNGAVQSSVVIKNKVAKLSVIGPLLSFCSITAITTDSVSLVNFATCEHAILLKIPSASLAWIKTDNMQLWYKIYDLICISIVALERSIDKLDIRLNIETYNR